MATIDGGLLTNGSVPAAKLADPATIASTQIAQRSNMRWGIPMSAWRIWDNYTAVLAATPTSDDDLTLVGGTFGTNAPSIQTGDVKAVTKTRYARCLRALPANYKDGETVTIRAYAGMKTTVADTSATLDFSCYESDMDDTVSASDLVNTASQSMNSLTFANYDFVLTSTSLVAGSLLDIRVSIATVDSATITAVIGLIGNIELLVDTQG